MNTFTLVWFGRESEELWLRWGWEVRRAEAADPRPEPWPGPREQGSRRAREGIGGVSRARSPISRRGSATPARWCKTRPGAGAAIAPASWARAPRPTALCPWRSKTRKFKGGRGLQGHLILNWRFFRRCVQHLEQVFRVQRGAQALGRHAGASVRAFVAKRSHVLRAGQRYGLRFIEYALQGS